MTYDVSRRTSDYIETLFPPQAVNWHSQHQEADAAYRVEMRMEAVRRIATRAVDTIADTHHHVDARAEGNPMLEHELRRIEEAVSFCATELIARYMGHRP